MKNNFTLLYVEDDKIIRENFIEIFSTYFGKVLTTDNGNTALKMCAQNHIDVLILDVNIYGLDGISVATKLRETKDENELIILMMSSYSDKDKLLRAINLQLFAYLVKPVKNRELLNALNSIVETLNQKKIIPLNADYSWNENNQTLLFKDKEVQITKNEKTVINILIENKNIFMTACQIQEKISVEQEEEQANCNNIVQILSRLKKKIERLNTSEEHFIENCYGIGYKITIN
jgi:DNA-binding response OmpR family regulator